MNENTHNKSSNVQAKHVFQDILDETTFDFSDAKASEGATTKKTKNTERPKRQADNLLPKVDLSEWEEKSYGEILLYCREALFEIIARTEKLDSLMRYFLVRLVLLAGIYGVCLGWYAWNLQIAASAIKMPLVLLGTMGICFPALFAFNMFLGSKLNMKQTISLLLVANYVMAFFLASLAPILLFFTIATPDKHFVSLLNFTFCTLAGIFFLLFLWKGMRYLTLRAGKIYDSRIIRIWSLIYIFVATQLSWLLRPFMGDPGTFVLFRDIEGNFYIAMLRVFSTLAEKIM